MSFDAIGSAHFRRTGVQTNADRQTLTRLGSSLGLEVPMAAARDPDGTYDDALAIALQQPGRLVEYVCPQGTLDHESGTLPIGGTLLSASGQLDDLPVYVTGPAT